MPVKKKEPFYSKILLFGEYTILTGSMGLTIPFTHFNGQLANTNDNSYTDLDFAKRSNNELREYLHYLNKNADVVQKIIDISALENDLANDLFFESSIPESYGLGSSGALVAAIYSSYAHYPISPDPSLDYAQMNQLKSDLSILESYFHGTSSGIDPLICYLNHPLCIEDKYHISSVNLPFKKIENGDAIFLLSTEKPGKTAPLVKQFMEKMKIPGFKNIVDTQLIPITNIVINSLIEGKIPEFIKELQSLSLMQLNHFREMIPESYIDTWKEGLKSKLFTLKLCGSGGGGYILGFTKEFSQTKAYFTSCNKEIIPVYLSSKQY